MIYPYRILIRKCDGSYQIVSDHKSINAANRNVRKTQNKIFNSCTPNVALSVELWCNGQQIVAGTDEFQ